VHRRTKRPATFSAVALAFFACALLAAISPSPGALASDKGELEVAHGDVHYVAGGELRFERPADFGLAVTYEQVLVQSYIPPCDYGFDYCLYYIEQAFAGTNFESAGLRIQRRADLLSEEACLEEFPRGFLDLAPEVHRGAGYATGRFGPLGDAAVGHYATGYLYRLFASGACFEFETRVGYSQYANYDPGTINEFTEADMEAMERRLAELLSRVRLADRPHEVLFPVEMMD